MTFDEFNKRMHELTMAYGNLVKWNQEIRAQYALFADACKDELDDIKKKLKAQMDRSCQLMRESEASMYEREKAISERDEARRLAEKLADDAHYETVINWADEWGPKPQRAPLPWEVEK